MFHSTLTELLSLPLDIPALMIHTWINHTARQTAAYSMIMQNRETPLGHAISTTACFLTAASMIIRRSAMGCATDVHHWAATIWGSARDLFLQTLMLIIKLPEANPEGQATEHQAEHTGTCRTCPTAEQFFTRLEKELQRYGDISCLCIYCWLFDSQTVCNMCTSPTELQQS